MSQRINIQYSVTTEEIEAEINRLLNSALIELKSTQDIFRDTTAVFSQQVLDDVAKIRQSLMYVDVRLDDVANIISGYLALKHAPPSGLSEPSQKMNDLKEQLANFKDQFSTDQNDEVSD